MQKIFLKKFYLGTKDTQIKLFFKYFLHMQKKMLPTFSGLKHPSRQKILPTYPTVKHPSRMWQARYFYCMA